MFLLLSSVNEVVLYITGNNMIHDDNKVMQHHMMNEVVLYITGNNMIHDDNKVMQHHMMNEVVLFITGNSMIHDDNKVMQHHMMNEVVLFITGNSMIHDDNKVMQHHMMNEVVLFITGNSMIHDENKVMQHHMMNEVVLFITGNNMIHDDNKVMQHHISLMWCCMTLISSCIMLFPVIYKTTSFIEDNNKNIPVCLMWCWVMTWKLFLHYWPFVQGIHWLSMDSHHQWIPSTGPRFNIKMSSYRYRKSHCGDKTVVRSSYLHHGISYTGKMTSLYWIRAQMASDTEPWCFLCCLPERAVEQTIEFPVISNTMMLMLRHRWYMQM